MKIKRALVLGVSSLFLFAAACGDDTGEFFNGSSESSVASIEESVSSSEEVSIEESVEESSIEISSEESSEISSEISSEEISSSEISSSEVSSESSSTTTTTGSEEAPVGNGDTGQLDVNLNTTKEFPNYNFQVSSGWNHLAAESQSVNDEILQGYIADGVENDITFLVDYYDVYGDPTVAGQDYFIINYISIEYSDATKDRVTVDYLMESMTPSYLTDYGAVETTTVNGIDFKYVRGNEINTRDYGLFALASDSDNSYAGFTIVFTDGAVSFDQALSFFDVVIRGITFK